MISPDGVFARALSFFPVTAPTTVVVSMGQTDLYLSELLASPAVILLSGVLLLYVSERIPGLAYSSTDSALPWTACSGL